MPSLQVLTHCDLDVGRPRWDVSLATGVLLGKAGEAMLALAAAVEPIGAHSKKTSVACPVGK